MLIIKNMIEMKSTLNTPRRIETRVASAAKEKPALCQI